MSLDVLAHYLLLLPEACLQMFNNARGHKYVSTGVTEKFTAPDKRNGSNLVWKAQHNK